MKIAIDTNIIIDLIDDRRPGHKNALYLVELAGTSEIELIAFVDSILTAKYILRKQDDIETIEALDLLYDILHITDTRAEAVRKALKICKEHNFSDIEDVAKLIGAKDYGCELFVTNDSDLLKLEDLHKEVDIAVASLDEVVGEFAPAEGIEADIITGDLDFQKAFSNVFGDEQPAGMISGGRPTDGLYYHDDEGGD